MKDRHLAGGAAAACAICCAAPLIGFLGLAGFAAAAATLAFAGVAFALVVGLATLAALVVRRSRFRRSGCETPADAPVPVEIDRPTSGP